MRPIDADALIAEMHNVILEDGEDRKVFYEVIERQPTIEERKIDEACIDHNVMKLVAQLTESMYEFGDNTDWYKMTLGEISGITTLAEALKEVLKA